ncbi:MAG: ergothioneine biosynthesis protein EgtB [Pseudomonadota bacterium]
MASLETSRGTLSPVERYLEIRQKSLSLCAPLELEDHVVQPCPEVSPPKWHLAHTTWFFEQLINKKFGGTQDFDPLFPLLFNSYYKTAGRHWLQSERGQLSRPTLERVLEYRKAIDGKLAELCQERCAQDSEFQFYLELGLQHEQQHQELLLMDILRILATNPSSPSYSSQKRQPHRDVPATWTPLSEGVHFVGYDETDFCYDNESPRHKVYLHPCEISDGLVTNGEYLEFIQSGGYQEPRFWLSRGWDWLNENHVESPLYWRLIEGQWLEFTLLGEHPIDPNKPVSHISYFEADAFARWKSCRLPTEFELERFHQLKKQKETVDQGENLSAHDSCGHHLDLWAWSSSHYSPYPGFQKFSGPVEEYNGKFMCGQFVLKGGCFATPKNHYRLSYRNFYEPHQRWMFSGIRLAKDLTWNS